MSQCLSGAAEEMNHAAHFQLRCKHWTRSHLGVGWLVCEVGRLCTLNWHWTKLAGGYQRIREDSQMDSCSQWCWGSGSRKSAPHHQENYPTPRRNSRYVLGTGLCGEAFPNGPQKQSIKGPDNPTSQLHPVVEAARRKKKGQRRWWRIHHFKSCMWKVVCDKVVCERVVCERLSVKVWKVVCVCDKVVYEIVWKITCDKAACERLSVTKSDKVA